MHKTGDFSPCADENYFLLVQLNAVQHRTEIARRVRHGKCSHAAKVSESACRLKPDYAISSRMTCPPNCESCLKRPPWK